MATVMTEKPKTAPVAAIAVCEGVSRVYRVGGEDVYAVREVSCEIRAGQLVALRGRSKASQQ
jgi:ABC-type lipoprotein export system ATPase subunit